MPNDYNNSNNDNDQMPPLIKDNAKAFHRLTSFTLGHFRAGHGGLFRFPALVLGS